MDKAKDERDNGPHKADQKLEKDDEINLLQEILVASLIQWEVSPLLVWKLLSKTSITMIGVASLRNVSIESHFMGLAVLLFDLGGVIKE